MDCTVRQKHAKYPGGRPQVRKACHLAGQMAFGILLLVCGCSTNSLHGAEPAKVTSAMDVLPLFTAENVPTVGPEEIPIDPPNWTFSPGEAGGLPGRGLAQHPMLYIGEGCNKMFLV